MENRPLSTSSTSNREIGWNSSFVEKGDPEFINIGPQVTIGEEVDRWIEPAAPNPPVDGPPVAMTEPDARGVVHRLGEDHPKTKLTNEQVEEIRTLYEAGLDGTGERVGYRTLAKMFDTNKRTIRGIVNYSRRNAWPDRWAVPRSTKRRRRKRPS